MELTDEQLMIVAKVWDEANIEAIKNGWSLEEAVPGSDAVGDLLTAEIKRRGLI